jgi:hypothetical protein
VLGRVANGGSRRWWWAPCAELVVGIKPPCMLLQGCSTVGTISQLLLCIEVPATCLGAVTGLPFKTATQKGYSKKVLLSCRCHWARLLSGLPPVGGLC